MLQGLKDKRKIYEDEIDRENNNDKEKRRNDCKRDII